jgi:signal transduction histidine kinase
MSPPLLAGVVAAWSVCHLALGLYFLLAFTLVRRERELLLFALLCFSLAICSAGVSLDYTAVTPAEHLRADMLLHSGAIIAAALNLHFALTFAKIRHASRIATVAYLLALVFEVANPLGLLWSGHEVRETMLFGARIPVAVATPSALGYVFYVSSFVEALSASLLLVHSWRSGRREALSAVLGAALVLPPVANDVLVALGFLDTVTMLPHGFLIYAFGVGGTLLMRYHLARVELERAATSLVEKSEALRHSHAELRQLQNELTSKKQLAAVGELAAAIAHEVRNPLAVIVNAVSGLRRRGIRDEERGVLLDIVDEEAGRLNRLVGDLLRFARPVNVSRSPVSIEELAGRSAAMLSSEYSLVIESGGEDHVVWVDPNLFRLVFDNLISNACQAMRDGGTIRVSIRDDLHSTVPSALIAISDQGEGMAPEVQRRALDPFFTTRPSGTGLGLPIVQRIVEAHGGEVAIDSTRDAGTTITLSVPIARPRDEVEEESVTRRALTTGA